MVIPACKCYKQDSEGQIGDDAALYVKENTQVSKLEKLENYIHP